MHNLLSYNQLAEWNHFEPSYVSDAQDEFDKINDYFDCLIECDEEHSTCKRVCRSILSSPTDQ